MAEARVLEAPVEAQLGEPEVAHVGRKEDITRAYVTGEAIQALCGAVFIPSRDPSRYPVCEACKRELAGIRAGRSGNN